MTLPVEVGQEEVVLDLYQRWQADALRDSDGTAIFILSCVWCVLTNSLLINTLNIYIVNI